MFGYMGFGMQSYVHKRKPKKPFVKHGSVPSFTPLTEDRREFKLKSHKPENSIESGLIKLLFILLIAFISVIFCLRFNHYQKNLNTMVEHSNRIENTNAFSFLMNSGIDRLAIGNTEGAFSEFSLAHQIDRNNEELNQLLIETLSVLCSENRDYCEKLEIHLEELN
ncbi:hypothetical protein H7U19_11505 [Hyunsoonleella sp. SJ7]|uniref:Uncharacterized protein n=1 Tax=Hyunsoonleella aquatilis TaxID=2762758 RepID=A0A923KGT5_9FLAO|nr:hypothetical protein [Hyunsoonleella aquatilis]MBC3759036.1 hypothetical protein [Hyunsoonleella aquatilis]